MACIWLLQRGCAERLGGVLVASDSLRKMWTSLGSEHISALGKILKMGVETLWCYAGQQLAAPGGVCGGGGKRALGVGFAA